MYTDATMRHMAESYSLYRMPLHIVERAYYRVDYLRNPVACPTESAQSFFVASRITRW